MKFHFAVSLFFLFILTACGGGDVDGNTGGNTPPPPGTNIYYVSSTAVDDTGDGLTPATAKQTITAAIDAASTNTPAEVRVNAGTYTVDSTAGIDTHIVLIEGVSLYGGYNNDFSMRDPDTNISVITDIGTGGSPSAPKAAITDSTGVTSATILEGFTINGSDLASTSSAINLTQGSSPIIRNCQVNGGGNTALTSIGLRISGSSPTVENNVIHGGTASSSSQGLAHINSSSATINGNEINGGISTSTTGISNYFSTPNLISNYINGGSAVASSYGIYNASANITVSKQIIYAGNSGASSTGFLNRVNATALLVNNIISGGTADQTYIIINGYNTNCAMTARNNILFSGTATSVTYGITNYSYSTFDFENNIMFSEPAPFSFAIQETAHAASDFTSVKNNDIYGFETVYFDYESNCTSNLDGDNRSSTCTLLEMENLTDIASGVSGNVSVDPIFIDIDGADDDINTINDNDWHFSAMSPASITAGGLNGLDQMPAWTFDTDMDGIVRPASGTPWAMGAYEPVP